MNYRTALIILSYLLITNAVAKEQQFNSKRQVFPHKMPDKKPGFPLSAAMERLFDYPAPRAQDNDLFTQFRYTRPLGFDYNGGDGTISRRDPTRPILVDGTYYVWYTKRHTKTPPIGSRNAAQATDEIPSTDWDLADLWYATSKDGFSWKEQGVAVPRPAKPHPGSRSVATPDILVWEGKYYLYYQAFDEPSGLKGDLCVVTASVADSPNGPWTPVHKTIVGPGPQGDWDQNLIHDPMPIVYKGKIHLYFKATYNKWPNNRKNYAVAHGLAISDNPLGPFKKHPLNPISNSGHEALYFPYKEGVAAVITTDGNERNTIQYAADGVNFHIASVISLPPHAGAPFTPDAFTNTSYGRGISWGMNFFYEGGKGKQYSVLSRFDADLSLDVEEPELKQSWMGLDSHFYFSRGLNKQQKQRAIERNQMK